ncbi:NAD-dependent protein deacetylase sirtuin-2 [Cichlidogyrus casuarinus]|uniref:NAD-dependent protein deacetylase sirtuin-2 n=1 Tax=Cichlidogyrus casuarinus TaxID=1844966 RepID=A0ABD2QJA3_9PLAT
MASNTDDDLVEKLEKLDINQSSDDVSGELELSVFDLESVVQYIEPLIKKKNLNLITLAGAGISTSAGIPDFRSPKTGLYDNLEQYKLSDPMDVFRLDFFRQDPKPFYEVSRKLLGTKTPIKPTVAHYFINLLHKKGILKRHYTQNIDGLEVEAGLPEDKIVEAHGHFRTGHCISCGTEYPYEFLKDHILGEELLVPTCNKDGCKKIVKPDIVFFGESLPDRFNECLKSDFDGCNLLIIIGTSLAVSPFNMLPNLVSKSTPRLFINRELASAPVSITFSDDLVYGRFRAIFAMEKVIIRETYFFNLMLMKA